MNKIESGGGDGKMVCVTGGSGFIGSWLVKVLLQQGYSVKASIRDPNKASHLLSLDGASDRLQLFRANLLEQGSFDSAIQGCVGVFHTASPVSFSVADPQTELIDPAVKGTLNVLKSCAKAASVKRVILTSSVSTVFYTGKPWTQDSVADETCFSDPAVCQQLKLWYPLSKTLAEKAAWEFAQKNQIDLITILPGFVIGPLLHPSLCLSLDMILNLVNGSQTYSNSYYRSVDVRDVVETHIKAFETPSASGRYCLVGSIAHFSQVLEIIHQLYPTLHLPDKGVDSSVAILPKFAVSKEKAETLGINFTPLEVSLRDTIQSLKENGFLRF